MNEDSAKCNHCGDTICCKGSSTTGLLRHLARHNILASDKGEEASPSPSTSSAGEPTKKKPCQMTIQESLGRKESLEEILARLAAEDGFPVSAITNSRFIRSSLPERGHFLPRNPSQVMKLIQKFFDLVIQSMKHEIAEVKKRKGRFSLTTDEYTKGRNRRYMNINLHHQVRMLHDMLLL